MEEDAKQVEVKWLESILALRKSQNQFDGETVLEMVSFQNGPLVDVGGASSSRSPLTSRPRVHKGYVLSVNKGLSGLKKVKIGKAGRKGANQTVNRADSEGGARVVVEKGVIEKGKSKWVSKPRKKPMSFEIQNGKLNLEKKKSSIKGYASSSEVSSSLEEVAGYRPFLNSQKLRGETSRKCVSCVGVDHDDRLLGDGPEADIRSNRRLSPRKFPLICLEKAQLGIKPRSVRICFSCGISTKEEIVKASIAVENEVSGKSSNCIMENNLGVINSTEAQSCYEGMDSEEVFFQASIAIENLFSSARIVLDRSYSSVELVSEIDRLVSEEELIQDTVVVESARRGSRKKGRLSSCHSNKHSMKTRNFKAQNSVNLEEEVAKTMETSEAIGFDFSGFEEELVEVEEMNKAVEKEAEIPKVGVSGSAYSEELVLATVAVEEDTAPSETRIPNSASKKKGKFSNGSIIKHRMKTRNSGIIEEEVSKVMEVGSMLGFDFTSIEQEMSEAIASREAEDLARMEDQEGR
ncbi:hypothetical protein LWI29_030119 [Acer saccharum]|uniref:Uncharacterized protein n=1 Tax=Acer saccharum TaxID=4024 RepID=A0AA39SZS6_ACESA|nr:hypothetical protein LWI29_030119 [Acer saccharum]